MVVALSKHWQKHTKLLMTDNKQAETMFIDQDKIFEEHAKEQAQIDKTIVDKDNPNKDASNRDER